MKGLTAEQVFDNLVDLIINPIEYTHRYSQEEIDKWKDKLPNLSKALKGLDGKKGVADIKETPEVLRQFINEHGIIFLLEELHAISHRLGDANNIGGQNLVLTRIRYYENILTPPDPNGKQ